MLLGSNFHSRIISNIISIAFVSNLMFEVSTTGSPIVHLDGLGALTGIDLISRDNSTYFGYFGIPYGQVSRHFDDSKPVGPCNGILTANKTSEFCGQYSRITQKHRGVEECLALNVLTRNVTDKLPGIVWIHNGGFQNGGTFPRQAELFIDENVVYVSFRYGLGVFGFFDTSDGIIQGNMGLKDQVLALKWVQKHIASFGGNPSLVSIAGLSAGSASVNYHLLSPISKGLFHRGIMLSRSSLNPWALQTEPERLYNELLELSNCRRNANLESVECPRSLDEKDLLCAYSKIPVTITNQINLYLPKNIDFV